MKNERPTYEELVEKNAVLQQQTNFQARQIAILKYELQQLKKAITGPRSERFIAEDDDPPDLFSEQILSDNTSGIDEHPIETDVIVIKKKRTGKQPKRSKMPSHLPVEEIILEPKVDTKEMEKIGQYESWKYTVVPPEIKILKPYVLNTKTSKAVFTLQS